MNTHHIILLLIVQMRHGFRTTLVHKSALFGLDKALVEEHTQISICEITLSISTFLILRRGGFDWNAMGTAIAKDNVAVCGALFTSKG